MLTSNPSADILPPANGIRLPGRWPFDPRAGHTWSTMIGNKKILLGHISTTRCGEFPVPTDTLDLGPDAFAVAVQGDYLLPDYADADVLLCDPDRRRTGGGLCGVTLRHDNEVPGVPAGTLIVRRVSNVGRRGYLLTGGDRVVPFTIRRRSLIAAVPVVASFKAHCGSALSNDEQPPIGAAA